MLRSGVIAIVLAAVPAAPAAAEEKSVPTKREKMVCKTVGDTQWRTSRSRVCKTKAEWEAITRDARKEYQDYNRTGSFGDLSSQGPLNT